MAAHTPEDRLLHEDVKKLTLRLSLPGLVSMLASGLSTLFDALFLSRVSSALAAAAALCFPLVTLIQTIGFTLGMGAGSFVSRELGAKDGSSRAQVAASTALCAALILGGLLCLFGQLAPDALLHLLGARNDMLPACVPYARFILACAPLNCSSLVLASLLRAQGFLLPGMFSYCVGAFAGILLCAVLMLRFSLGILGAGIAMLVREALILCVFVSYIVRSKSVVRPVPRAVSFHLQTIADIMRSGTATLVRQGLSSISGAMFSRTLARYGESAVAGMGLALRFVNLVSCAIIGYGQGFAPVCGANWGAGRIDRVQYAYRFCLRILVASLLLLGAAVYVFSPALSAHFTPDEAACTFAAASLRAQSLVFFAQGAIILMNMLTQSIGFPVRAALVASARQGYILIPLLLIFPRLFGAWGLILAQPVSDAASLAIGWLLTRSILNAKKKAG